MTEPLSPPPDLDLILTASLAAASLVASWAGTGLVRKYLIHKDILDHPNHRSSHEVPTPRGGGVAVTSIICLALLIFDWQGGNGHLAVLPLALLTGLLGLISWLDDLWDLSALARLIGQLIVAAIGLYVLENGTPYFSDIIPAALDRTIALLGWVWFINLFNFMDGIDGITGVESISIALGGIALALISGSLAELIIPCLIIVATMVGFLIWNWHPAKIFLGDVGSVPLGFLLGGLLLYLAQQGYLIPALILGLYYLADATITLTKRLLRRERIWHAHREHFYQQATQKGLSHARVSTMIALTNTLLLVLAVFALSLPVFAIIGSLSITTVLLIMLRKPSS